MDAINKALIIRITGDRVEELEDRIAVETTFTLYVNGEILVSLLCTPTELDALAVGFLISEGLLSERRSLQSVDVDEKRSIVSVRLHNLPPNWNTSYQKKTITSGCGKGVTFANMGEIPEAEVSRRSFALHPETIRTLLKRFAKMSDLYLKTGGVHSAALADIRGDILLFSEDIGRHNAVDKLIGKAFLADVKLDDKLLCTSGRVSGEIMTKVIRRGIPVLISRTAPTCMSIAYAEHHGVTLIGFARGKRMNVYTHPLRISLAPDIRVKAGLEP